MTVGFGNIKNRFGAVVGAKDTLGRLKSEWKRTFGFK